MPRDRVSYLTDILNAATDIVGFTEGLTQDSYLASTLVRPAVERKFEIMGEALNQLVQPYPDLRGRIPEERLVINFRNRLIHGYFAVDDLLIWSAAKVDLPPLIEEIRQLLEEVKA